MSETQGRNIAEWQAQQRHQESQREKSGFGLGYGDSVATIVDGIKWLFNFHEGAISAYCNIFENLVNGNSLVTLLGKSGNMLGIKFFESLAEYFSDGEERENPLSEMNNIRSDYGPNPDDYPHVSSEIGYNAEGLRDTHNADDYRDQPLLSAPSPSVSNDYGHEIGS